MKVIPQENRIIVEPIEEDDGGIVIPDNAKDKYQRVRVVAVGPGRVLSSGETFPIPLQEGDEVVFDRQFCTRLVPDEIYDNRKLAVVEYEGVLVKIERAQGEIVRQKSSVIVQAKARIVTPR